MYSKPGRSPSPLRENSHATGYGEVEAGEVLGAELSGEEFGEVGEVGEFGDQRQDPTERRTDDKAGHAL